MNPSNDKKTSPFTRRGFLKTTSAAVAGGALFASMPGLARAGTVAGSDTLKVALIGCGGRGTGAAAQALSTEGSVKLVAMCDAFKDRLDGSLNNLKSNHGDNVDVPADRQFVGFYGFEQAIELADVVILATPPGFRPMHFEACVNAGKHVFMEKPVAVDGPGVRKVLAAAKKAKEKNLKVGVGLQRHHQYGYQETIKRLQDGEIGDIVSARCYWNGGGVWVRGRQPEMTEMEYQMRNWYYFNWLCGDHIVEQHIHNIDVINWAKGMTYPVRAQGMGARRHRTGIDHGEIFDQHFVEFEYADGSRMYSQCRHQPGWSSVSEHVQGTKGRSNIGGYVIEGENNWRYRGDNPNPYQVEHDVLFDAIRNNKEFNEAENGAKSTLCSVWGRMCTYSNEMITWDQALNSEIDLMPETLAWDANPPVLPDSDGRYAIAQPGSLENIV